ARGRAKACAGRGRSGRQQGRARGDPSRRGRRRGRPVGGRPLPDAHPVRRAAWFHDGAALGERERGRRVQGDRFRRQGRGRVLRLQVGGRHAPRPARAGDRVPGADSHVARDGCGHARGRGGGGRCRPERPEDRRLPLDRAGRTEREHDRFGRPDHAPPDRTRGCHAGRKVSDPEPREGAPRAACAALRAGAVAAACRARERSPFANRLRGAGGEDPHLQLPREPRDRPPGEAHAPPPRLGARRRSGRVHRGPFGRGAPPRPRGRCRLTVTVAEALREAAADLEEAGWASPSVDAEWLLADVLGTTRTGLYVRVHPLEEEELRRLRALGEGRRTREPLAYVLGEWGFRRLILAVDPRVLIPRPETEIVVERCLELLRPIERPQVLDVGVGSGAIALAIADERPDASVVGTDSSADALSVAAANKTRVGANGRVELWHGDLLAGVSGPFDLVVSNPPYVSPADVNGLPPEVLHE